MEKITMNVQELVRAVAEETGMTQKSLKEVMKAMDKVVTSQLSVATPSTSVEVKLLPSGLTVMSEYKEAHEGHNPSTGEVISIPAKKRVKTKITAGFKSAVNA